MVGGDALGLECGLIGRTAPPRAAEGQGREIQAKIIVALLGAARSSFIPPPPLRNSPVIIRDV